jgi:hypothetical protein
VGKNGTMLHYDGASWQTQAMPTTANLLGVFGVSDQLAWAVGEGGAMLLYDGHSWNQADSGTTSNLRGVWGLDDKNAWAVGDAVILRYIP